MRFGVAAAVSLALVSNEASATVLGSLATSVGFFAVLAIALLGKTWPAGFSAAGWPAVAAALLIAGGAAWFWRVRAMSRVPVLSSAMGRSTMARPSRLAIQISLPPALDHVQLLKELRLHFVTVQAAWDREEMDSLRTLTTPEMLLEFTHQCQDCTPAAGRECTEVVLLRANLLGFEDLRDALVATVEFSGLMREGAERGADPFREVWMLTKSKQGAEHWRLARHQALL
jgi:predicted lipid-binding transport protein (Tim44 family)